MKFCGKFAAPVWYANKRAPDPNIVPMFERDLMFICDDFGLNPLEEWGLASCSPDSVYLNVAKYQREQPRDYDLVAWRKAVSTAKSYLRMVVHNPRELSFEEALGVFPRQASPGPTMGLWGHSKGEVLETPEAVDFMRVYDANHHYRSLQRGVPKEEIRPMSKILLNTNRSILVVGMDHMVTGFRLWWDMNNQMLEGWYQASFPIKVGFTPFYGGWHVLSIPFVGRPVGSYDVSARDSSLSRLHFEAILEIRLSLMSDPSELFVERASFSYSDSTYGLVVMPDGFVFEKDTGNSTGSHNTISDNSIGSLVEICYAFHKKFPSWSSVDLRNNLLLAIVGDDVRCSPSKEVAEVFSQDEIREILQTDLLVSITWETRVWSSLMDTTWLSMRTAIYSSDWLVPVPAEPTKLLASCYYGRENYSALDTLRRLVNFRMLSYTDPQLFKYFDAWTWELVAKNKHVFSSDKEWQDLVASIMPISSLEHLYLGWESGSTLEPPQLGHDDCMDQDFGPWLSSLRPAVVPPVAGNPSFLQEKVNQSYQPRKRGRFLSLVAWLLLLFCGVREPMAQAVCRELAKSSSEVMGVGGALDAAGPMGRFSPMQLYEEMSKKNKNKKPRTPEQRAKRAAAKKRRRERRRSEGKKLQGSGDYRGSADRRLRPQLRGAGDFWDDAIGVGKNLLGKGISAANWISDNAGWLSGLIGAGDYNVSKIHPKVNSLWNRAATPSVSNSSFSKMILRHREEVAIIKSSQAFQIASIVLNPGLPTAMPWGNGCAALFQRYRVLGAIVEAVSECAPYGGSNILGSLCIGARYDVTLPAPTTFRELENTEGSVVGRPLDNLMMAVECDPAMVPVNVLQVRTGSLPSQASLQMFDHCIIDIANQGQADATLDIARIFISYEIELELPVDTDLVNGVVLTDHFQLNTITSANNFGATVSSVSTSTLGGTIVGGATAKYTFPSYIQGGKWLVSYNNYGTGATVTNYTLTVTGCTKAQIFSNNAGPDANAFAMAPAAGQAGQTQVAAWVLDITAPSATFALSGATVSGTTYGDLIVTQFNGDVVTLNRARHRWAKYWRIQDEEHRLRQQEIETTARRLFESMLSERRLPVDYITDDEKDQQRAFLQREVKPTLLWRETDEPVVIEKRGSLSHPVVQPVAPGGGRPAHG